MAATRRATAEVVAAADLRPVFSRTDWLVGILRDRILKGAYRPGDRIVEIQLQQEFGFSNGPIREALHRLVADGLAERLPARGVRVIQMGKKELAELFHLRLALLEYAAELAALRASTIDPAEARELKKLLRTALSRVRKGKLDLMNGELMQWVLKVADNKPIADTWNKTMLQTRIYVYEAMLRTAAKTEPIQYRIVDAIVAGNVALARRAARELTRQTLADLNIETTV